MKIPNRDDPAKMDPRKLLYFAEIIEQGSLQKAAMVLNVSQPALSKSMKRLEIELNLKLFDRGSYGVVPTPGGELIYAHAKLIRTEMELAEKRLRGKIENSNLITIGVLPSLASNVIPLAVAKWKNDYPLTLLRVIEKKQVELILGLLRGEFDFIIGQTEFFDVSVDGLKQRVLFRDSLCIFAKPDHDLFKLEKLGWSDLARYPWVCPMIAWPQRAILESLVTAEGIDPPQQLVECGSIEFIKTLVSTSNHLAMLPIHAIRSIVKEGSLKALPFSASAFKRNIAVIFRANSNLDVASQELITVVEMVGNEMTLGDRD